MQSEMFEYARGFKQTTEQLRALLLKNVDAIFDDSCKEELKKTIEAYRI